MAEIATASGFRRRLMPYAMATLTSPHTRATRRWLAEGRRRLRREPHRVLYFHQVDDPYSQLAAQALPEFLRRYDVSLAPQLVDAPGDAAAPERALLAAFARRDAADVAPGYGLAFPPRAVAPRAPSIELAARILAAAVASGDFASCASRVGAALWARDDAGLRLLAAERGAASPEQARAAQAAGAALREQLGHYLGGMFFYAGEWYWGVDRLQHLERRLQKLGALRSGVRSAPIAPRPALGAAAAPASRARIALEFYPSLRSPYSYLAMQPVFELARRYPIDLALRPVLPMVMRGLPVPRVKQLYILLDSKREAEDLGVPFGRVCDPVGRPVERCFSLYRWACARGRGPALLHAFTRAAFAEGIDTGSDSGMRHVVERAGLSWDEARAQPRDEGWREELERNRAQLFALGLWGVPSFRILGGPGEPDFCTWGQDRLWRVEAELRERMGG
jgi:2-hydroxychromene-2-carboxylate isomerase